jgi:hypothetical protein
MGHAHSGSFAGEMWDAGNCWTDCWGVDFERLMIDASHVGCPNAKSYLSAVQIKYLFVWLSILWL